MGATMAMLYLTMSKCFGIRMDITDPKEGTHTGTAMPTRQRKYG